MDLPSLRLSARRRARGASLHEHPSGRYRRAAPYRPGEHVELAADATLRAMALRRALSGSEIDGPITADLRTKVRLRPSGSLIVFAIDASDSMNAERRMALAKGAVMALLVTAQVTGDRVALVSFEGDDAEVVLQPTASMTRARARLRCLSTGGATPLAAGLWRALSVVRAERLRDPLVRPKLVLSTDGEANVPRTPGADIASELDALGAELRGEGIESVVIDSNPRFTRSDALVRLSHTLGAAYYAADALDAGKVAAILSQASGGARRV